MPTVYTKDLVLDGPEAWGLAYWRAFEAVKQHAVWGSLLNEGAIKAVAAVAADAVGATNIPSQSFRAINEALKKSPFSLFGDSALIELAKSITLFFFPAYYEGE